MGQVGFQVGHRARVMALSRQSQPPVAVVCPAVRLQHDQAVQYRYQTRPVLLRGVNFLEVVEHAADDVAGCR